MDRFENGLIPNEIGSHWHIKPDRFRRMQGVHGLAIWMMGSKKGAAISASNDMTLKNQATITGWVTGKGVILSRMPANGTWRGKGWLVHNTEGAFELHYDIRGKLTCERADFTRWQHFALVRNGNQLTWYLNGKKSRSAKVGHWPADDALVVRAGAAPGNPFKTKSLVGGLDDLRFTIER